MNISINNETAIRQYILNSFDTSSPTCFVNDFNNKNKSTLFADFINNKLGLSFSTDAKNSKVKTHQIISYNKDREDRVKPAIDLIVKTLKEM